MRFPMLLEALRFAQPAAKPGHENQTGRAREVQRAPTVRQLVDETKSERRNSGSHRPEHRKRADPGPAASGGELLRQYGDREQTLYAHEKARKELKERELRSATRERRS